MRASRLLSMLLLLQSRGRMTAHELAEQLEVSVRTIYRDAESLGSAGVPIYADRGPAGGYQLLDGYRTRLTGLTGDEADSLFLVGMPDAATKLGLGAVLATAQLKLLAALPPDLRDRAGRIRERFYLDAPSWFQDADATPHLAVLADAVWNQRSLRIHYRRWQTPRDVRRTIDPLGIVLKAGVWYVVARVVDAEAAALSAEDEAGAAAQDANETAPAEDPTRQMRTYRVSHMLGVEAVADAHFERPAHFDLAAYWHRWSERFEASVYRSEAVLRLAPHLLERLPFLVNPTVARAAAASATPSGADGWLRVTLPIESVEHAAVELLRLGADAEVLEPPTLRERMARTAAALAQIYHAP